MYICAAFLSIKQDERIRIMKRIFAPVILFLLCFPAVLQAQEIKGIWAGAFEASDIFAAVGINFDESKIVLRFAGQEQTGAIKDLQIKDGEISFLSETRPRGKFTGKFDGEKISGVLEVIRSEGSRENGVWSVRKVDSLDFKDEPKTVSGDEKIDLPKPSGKFFIGRKLFYRTDQSRPETITADASDKRKVFVQLWFPADKAGKIAAEYYPNVAEIFTDADALDVRRTTKTHAFDDVKLAQTKTKFPVLVFSPGLGASPFSYAAIIENLVSRGYVVAAINHAYDSGDFKFSGGEIVRQANEKWDRKISKDWTEDQRRQFFDERRIEWAKDFSFVLGQLEKLEKPFKNKLDLQNVGAFGHSFGGQATSIACASDARFKACANLDGMAQGNVFLPDANGKVLKQPFMFFTKSAEVTNAELKMMNLARAEYRTRERKRLMQWKPSYKNRMAELESGGYLVLFPGVDHSSFSDWLILNPKENLPVERYAAARIINDYIAAFFDKFLLKKTPTLLDAADGSNQNQNVIVEFLKKQK